MEQQEKLQYQAIVHKMLGAMVQLKGSDLFLTAGFPPAIKLNGKLTKLNENPLAADQTSKMARAIASAIANSHAGNAKPSSASTKHAAALALITFAIAAPLARPLRRWVVYCSTRDKPCEGNPLASA